MPLIPATIRRRLLCAMLFSMLMLVTAGAAAQELNLLTGLSVDLRNQGRFLQVPLIGQLVFPRSGNRAMFLQLDIGAGLGHKEHVPAFTLNQQLAAETSITRNTSQSYAMALLGYRYYFKGKPGKRYFLDVMPVGLGTQLFRIRYGHDDPANYVIVNPDLNRTGIGYVLGVGVGIRVGPLTIQSHVYGPLLVGMGKYKNSFTVGAPAQLTAGYLINQPKNARL